MSTDDQPISRVKWVPHESLAANQWNPNIQAPPEFKLLRVSILENGWTQPIVTRAQSDGRPNEITDGYHRWQTAKGKDVAAMTGGLVPIVELAECDDDVARMATIRHNRARGSHHVLKMADIVAELVEQFDLDPAEVGRRLGMDPEEVGRLLDRGNMLKRGRNEEGDFSGAWSVENKGVRVE